MFVHQKSEYIHTLVYLVCRCLDAGDSLIEEIQDSGFIWFYLYHHRQMIHLYNACSYMDDIQHVQSYMPCTYLNNFSEEIERFGT